MSMDYPTAQKGIKETESLQKARRDFEQLKTEENEYFRDREERFQQRMFEMTKKADRIEKDLNGLDSLFSKRVEDFKNIFASWEDAFFKMIDRAGGLVNKSDTLKQRYEKMLHDMEVRIGLIDEAIIKNSEWEKDLNARETKVDRKLKEASQKLAKAERLAYWHKEPKAKYTKS